MWCVTRLNAFKLDTMDFPVCTAMKKVLWRQVNTTACNGNLRSNHSLMAAMVTKLYDSLVGHLNVVTLGSKQLCTYINLKSQNVWKTSSPKSYIFFVESIYMWDRTLRKCWMFSSCQGYCNTVLHALISHHHKDCLQFIQISFKQNSEIGPQESYIVVPLPNNTAEAYFLLEIACTDWQVQLMWKHLTL